MPLASTLHCMIMKEMMHDSNRPAICKVFSESLFHDIFSNGSRLLKQKHTRNELWVAVNTQVLLPEVVMQLDPRSSNSGSSSSGTISRSDTPLPASLAGPISAPEEDLQAGTAAEGENPEQSVSPEHASAAEEGQLYPAIRRASRLSFCMATALPGSFDGAEGRQVPSRISSVCGKRFWS